MIAGRSDVLEKYKHQPMLEKRHEQLKSQYAVMPVLFKNVVRIEAFLFLYFVAMLIQALIERDARLSMKDQGMSGIPVYFEERECSSPTAYRLLSKFDNVLLNHILVDGREVKSVCTDLSDIQRQILALLHIEESTFRPDQ